MESLWPYERPLPYTFATDIFGRLDEENGWTGIVVFTDEVTFCISERVSRQDVRIRGSEYLMVYAWDGTWHPENNREFQNYAWPCGGTSCTLEGSICKSVLHQRIDFCGLRTNGSRDRTTSSVLVLTRPDPLCRRTLSLSKNFMPLIYQWSAWWRLRYFAWNLPNPSSRIMALGSTQPLTEIGTSDLPGGKGRPERKADNLTSICEPIFWKMLEPRRLTILWASTACYRDSFTSFLPDALLRSSEPQLTLSLRLQESSFSLTEFLRRSVTYSHLVHKIVSLY
jgi:hypothetical protein